MSAPNNVCKQKREENLLIQGHSSDGKNTRSFSEENYDGLGKMF